MEEKLTIKNRYGIPIVVCCASCAHNTGAETEKTRACDFGTKEKPSFRCLNWEMKRSLDNAGKGGGLVKKLAFLEYLRDYKVFKPIHEIEKEWEKKHGSIFINNI